MASTATAGAGSSPVAPVLGQSGGQRDAACAPGGGIVVRVLSEELQVGSYLLPKGTRLAPSIYLTNRSARVHGDPEAFRPERFLEAAGGRAISPFSWIPFGGGCVRGWRMSAVRATRPQPRLPGCLTSLAPKSRPVLRISVQVPWAGAQSCARSNADSKQTT